MSKTTNTNDPTLQDTPVFQALLFGLGIYGITLWTTRPFAIPLYGAFADLFSTLLIPLLTTLVLTLIAFQEKRIKTISCLIVFTMSVSIVARYSAIGAFQLPTATHFLFFLLFARQPLQVVRVGATLIISMTFFWAAIHKINPAYLAGAELGQAGSLTALLSPDIKSFLLRYLDHSYLPHFSIALELAFSALIWIHPALTMCLISLFLLCLSTINGYIFFVYFHYLPFFLILSPKLAKVLTAAKFANAFRSPFFWAAAIKFSISSLDRGIVRSITNTVPVVILIFLHLRFLFKNRQEHTTVDYQALKRPRVWAVPALVSALALLSFAKMIPSPFGLNMFSAKRFLNGVATMRVNSPQACRYAYEKIHVTVVSDSSIQQTADGNCEVLHPTLSGLLHLSQTLCLRFPQTNYELFDQNNTRLRSFNCQSQ